MQTSAKIKNKFCKGCAGTSYCEFMKENINTKGICPCTNCIVKMMCKNDENCPIFNSWAASYRENLIKKKRESYIHGG